MRGFKNLFKMILGIWDGHDSGAAIIKDGKIVVAVNEERFTRRKLEVLFPKNSIRFCLKSQGLNPNDIEDVAYSTSDFSLTLTRRIPKIKDDYYYVRRRIKKSGMDNINRKILNRTGRLRSNYIFQLISNNVLKKELNKLGFNNYKLHLVDHHQAHAATAYLASGMNKALTITMDGLGDGLSATVNVCNDGDIEKLYEIGTKDSLGLFYQEITALLGMRILEDEGKVMCLADYSERISKEKNIMMDFFKIEKGLIKCNISLGRRFSLLKNILENNKKEVFCRMAQDVLEHYCLNWFKEIIKITGMKNVCLAGGIFSNIKNNMNLIDNLDIHNWFIFPHMGDGGLAVGAALFVSNMKYGTKPYALDNINFGPEYTEEDVKKCLSNYRKKVDCYKIDEPAKFAAEEISKSKIIYWFNGKMEYGPRSLGNRSILALPSNMNLKDDLNRIIKRRSLYQPFCPSILEKDAKELLEPFKKADPFMTMGYKIKEIKRNFLAAAQSVDGSCRPQIIPSSDEEYSKLLRNVKKEIGIGAVLNTSFNIHGYPLVMSPENAIETLLSAREGKLVMGNFLVEIK